MELEYDVAYHMHCRLALQSGRTITLEAIDQQMTYAGLLEGTPDATSNGWAIESALGDAERYCPPGTGPHLIPPARRDYLREPGDMERIAQRSPHRPPEWLPMVRCIGSFKDVSPARDPDRHLSVLVVIWYQDEYAPPIREPALGLLRSLDWDSLATDIDI